MLSKSELIQKNMSTQRKDFAPFLDFREPSENTMSQQNNAKRTKTMNCWANSDNGRLLVESMLEIRTSVKYKMEVIFHGEYIN